MKTDHLFAFIQAFELTLRDLGYPEEQVGKIRNLFLANLKISLINELDKYKETI